MFARQAAVVLLQEWHRVGQVDEFGGPLGLDPLAEEAVVHDAQRRVWISGQVAGLHRGFPGADEEAALVIDRNDDRGELRPAIRPRGGEHSPRMAGDEAGGATYVHRARSGAVESAAALELVLVHDRAGVAMRNSVLVGKPVGAFGAAKEGGTRFKSAEPLTELESGYGRDAGDQVLVHLRGVGQGQVAPPG